MKAHFENTERVTIVMPATDARRLKHLAVDEGKSTSAVAREALRNHLDGAKRTASAENNERKLSAQSV